MIRRGRRGRRSRVHERLARERIAALLAQAQRWAGDGRLEWAHRCAGLARRIAMRYNQRLTRAQRRLVCRSCDRWLQPGVSSRVRLSRRGWVVVTCLGCGRQYRYPHRKPPERAATAEAER